MKKNISIVLGIVLCLVLVSCASTQISPSELSEYRTTKYDASTITAYFSEWPTSKFKPDENKIFFDFFTSSFSNLRNDSLKGVIGNILDDSFVYVALDYETVYEEKLERLNGYYVSVPSHYEKPKANSFSALNLHNVCTVVGVGTPESPNPENFIVGMNRYFDGCREIAYTVNYEKEEPSFWRDTFDLIYSGKEEERDYSTPILSGVSSYDFYFNEVNEFNSISPNEKLAALRTIKDVDFYDYVNFNAEDLPSNYVGNCPYDFTLLAHWYSREFKLDGTDYTGIVYHCVSSLETFTNTPPRNFTITAFITSFWIESFEVYNSNTGSWDWFEADEYFAFMEEHGLEMPVEFKEFIGLAPRNHSRWVLHAGLMTFDSSLKELSTHSSIFSPIKHYYSPEIEKMSGYGNASSSWGSVFY